MATRTRAPFLPKSSTISDQNGLSGFRSADLFHRESVPAWIALGTAAFLAWIVILQQPRIGSNQNVVGFASYLGMWTLMTAAMMFPSLSPVVYLWVSFIHRRVSGRTRVLKLGLFLSGYLVAWILTGIVA